MQTAFSYRTDDDFDAVLVAELETLRNGEKHLQRLYPQLRYRPELRDTFLRTLSEMRQRADRLNAVLNPLEAFQPFSGFSAAAATNPAA